MAVRESKELKTFMMPDGGKLENLDFLCCGMVEWIMSHLFGDRAMTDFTGTGERWLNLGVPGAAGVNDPPEN